MNRSIVFPVIATFALIGPAALGNVLALHEGANDPLVEGWSLFRGPLTTGPVTNDDGFDAWLIGDSGGDQEGAYFTELASSQVNRASLLGWTLTGIVDNKSLGDGTGDDGVVFGFNQSSTRFWVSIGTQADGTPIASFTGGPSVTLTGLLPTYHRYDVVYSPIASSADLFVDGIEVISNFAGNAESFQSGRVVFGSFAGGGSSQAGYSFVQMTLAPEPTSFALLGIASFMVSVNLRRRFAK